MKNVCKIAAAAALMVGGSASAFATDSSQQDIDITASVAPVCVIAAPTTNTIHFDLTSGRPDNTEKEVLLSVTCNGDSNKLTLSSAHGALTQGDGQPDPTGLRTFINYQVTAQIDAIDKTCTTNFTPPSSAREICQTDLYDGAIGRVNDTDNLSLKVKLLDEGLLREGQYSDTLTVEVSSYL